VRCRSWRIEKSFAAGYTHQEICDTLKEKAGIAIAPSTLKLYINRIKKAKENRKGREVKPKTVQNQTVEVAPPTENPPTAKQRLAKHFTKATPQSERTIGGFVEMPDEL
jgi:hypothetical protein